MTPESISINVLKRTLRAAGCPSQETDSVVDYLSSERLLDITHLHAWVARKAVDHLVRKECGKMDAIEQVAQWMNVSFYTVRKYVYSDYK